MHWTEIAPEEDWGDDEEEWVTCDMCGYQFDLYEDINCPNCGK